MKLHIISLANRADPWVNDAIETYCKRFPKEWRLNLIDLKPEARTSGKTTDQILAIERDKLRQAIPKNCLIVALDELGIEVNSLQLATKLLEWHNKGEQLCLLIGSADGLHQDIKQQSTEQWRLSSLTLPHALVKVIATEALYRAWSILNNHPYHRD
jgi:23S rRNA (pseudouridine1915-N3)-methyltransferase